MRRLFEYFWTGGAFLKDRCIFWGRLFEYFEQYSEGGVFQGQATCICGGGGFI